MKFGVMLPNLGPSQLAYKCINAANKYLEEQDSVSASIIVFYDELVRPCVQPNFACMQAYEVYNFQDTVIATTLNLAAQLANSPCPKQKFFYIWDLEWINLGVFNYNDVASIYQDSRLSLVCRSKDHSREIEKAWNRSPHLIENFDFKQYEQICR